ncbi:MAG: L-threonylcarbamoyladenylate synthase [Bacteroidota bacterium]|jgi:L-threonylcarbamoyladenylate synthase
MKENLEIQTAAEIIKKGGLVAFPTETVYGLGANALNPEAVARIFEMKERPSFDPLIVHISNLECLKLLCRSVDSRVYLLAEKFWPGPLTVVMPKSDAVHDIVTSGLESVAIRMPDHPIALQLIKASGNPIAAPSANKFGKLSPTKAAHVKKQLPNVDYILDGGDTSVGIESTVIALTDAGFQILRPGIITKEEIEAVIPFDGNLILDEMKPEAPGLLKSHYSPAKPMLILEEGVSIPKAKKIGYLAFQEIRLSVDYQILEVLSKSGDLKEAALNLFGALHRLEEADIDLILVEPIPENGIGIAIMDRLRKAAYQYK